PRPSFEQGKNGVLPECLISGVHERFSHGGRSENGDTQPGLIHQAGGEWWATWGRREVRVALPATYGPQPFKHFPAQSQRVAVGWFRSLGLGSWSQVRGPWLARSDRRVGGARPGPAHDPPRARVRSENPRERRSARRRRRSRSRSRWG